MVFPKSWESRDAFYKVRIDDIGVGTSETCAVALSYDLAKVVGCAGAATVTYVEEGVIRLSRCFPNNVYSSLRKDAVNENLNCGCLFGISYELGRVGAVAVRNYDGADGDLFVNVSCRGNSSRTTCTREIAEESRLDV